MENMEQVFSLASGEQQTENLLQSVSHRNWHPLNLAGTVVLRKSTNPRLKFL